MGQQNGSKWASGGTWSVTGECRSLWPIPQRLPSFWEPPPPLGPCLCPGRSSDGGGHVLAGGGGSAACSVHYGPARAPLSGGVPCCGRPRPPLCGDGGGGDGGCGPGGAVARNAVAAGGAPPQHPRPRPPPRPPPLPPPLPPGGGAECVARYKPSPCSLGSLCSRGSPSPKSPAGRGPGLDWCGGDGGDGGCGAQSWWKTSGGGCAGLSWKTPSSEASPPHCPPLRPLRRHQAGPGSVGDGGGGGDGGAGDPLWSPSSPLMLCLLSALHCRPEVNNTCQTVRWQKTRKCTANTQTHAD